ncbi:MAG: class I SAM-dependent methyltransferase [bacterium]|nr:class I SAM-dependent methyltransferase [bacterium]
MGGTDPGTARVGRSSSEARRTYDRLAPVYDLLAGAGEARLRETGLRLLAVREGERVLEIGCGTGRALVKLAGAAGGTGRVVGVDLSPAMLEKTRRRLAQSERGTRVELRPGDAMEVRLERGFFDAVFLTFTLDLFDTPDIPTLLSRCRDALRPGGRICIAAMDDDGKGPLLRLYGLAHRRFPRAVDCRPIPVRRFIIEAGFRVEKNLRADVWGLPAAVVLARN